MEDTERGKSGKYEVELVVICLVTLQLFVYLT